MQLWAVIKQSLLWRYLVELRGMKYVGGVWVKWSVKWWWYDRAEAQMKIYLLACDLPGDQLPTKLEILLRYLTFQSNKSLPDQLHIALS